MKEGMVQSDVAAVIQPRILFKPGSWLAKIDFINHLVLFNNVLITVLSEKEGGKTSFGTLLQNNLDQQIKSVSMTVKAPCNRENIISDIATQLHLNHDADMDITSIVAQINERKAHVLLMIDDAQHLPETLIKEAMLAIKNQENFGFFHLCLISDYSIVATLNGLTASFFDNLIHTIELGSLSESEARTYVLQRAMSAHLITKPLTDAQFKQFYQLTKGNVAKINCNLESFVFKCSTQKKKNPMALVKKAAIAVSIALTTGLAGFYFAVSDSIYSFDHATGTVQAQRDELVASFIEKSVQPEVLASYVASWQDSSTRQLVYAALPKKQILDDIDQEAPADTVAIVDKVVVIPKVNAKDFAKEEPNSPVMDKVLESQLVAISGFSYNEPSNPARSNTDSKLYTIQVAASQNKSDIERFQQKNKFLVEHAKVRHFSSAKGVWYVLTLGEYDSRSQAQRTISKLPATMAKLKPWVRPVSSLG